MGSQTEEEKAVYSAFGIYEGTCQSIVSNGCHKQDRRGGSEVRGPGPTNLSYIKQS